MSGGMLGMAPAQADAFAGRIAGDAVAMRDLLRQIASMVTEVAWFGHNADLFREDWEGRLQPQLVAVVEELDRTAQNLRRLAAAQTQLSNNGR
jgi:uncharacterized protein YukE